MKPPKKSRALKAESMARNIKAAAAKLELPEVLLRHLRDNGADGFRSNGNVDLDALRLWIEKNPDALKTSGVLDPALERALLVRARRERVEHDLAVTRRDYIHADEIKRTAMRYVGYMKTRLLATETNIPIQMRVEAGLAPEQEKNLRKILQSENRAILDALTAGEWIKEETKI